MQRHRPLHYFLLALVLLSAGNVSGCFSQDTNENGEAARDSALGIDADSELTSDGDISGEVDHLETKSLEKQDLDTENEPVIYGPEKPPGLPSVVTGNVRNSLYESFGRHFDLDNPAERLLAQQLAAHFKRLFFFDVNFRKDLRPEDHYALIWQRTDESTDGLRILAARYESKKLGKTFEAYFFKDTEDPFPRHYNGGGVSVQKDLKNSPIPNYEQVTALLNDRRPRHLGIDFKAPVGTSIHLPFDADVIGLSKRITRHNGRWIKVRYRRSGLEALFLHLNRIEPVVKPGAFLKAGTGIAESGNTGRSYAPHLHYQVQRRKGRVLDPYDVHGETRRRVSKKGLDDYKKTVGKYLRIMCGEV